MFQNLIFQFSLLSARSIVQLCQQLTPTAVPLDCIVVQQYSCLLLQLHNYTGLQATYKSCYLVVKLSCTAVKLSTSRVVQLFTFRVV